MVHEMYKRADELVAGDVFQLIDNRKRPYGMIYVLRKIAGIVARSGVFVLETNNGHVNIACDEIVVVTKGE